MRSGEPTLLLVANRALYEAPLMLANRIAHATGAKLYSGRPTGRKQSGAGRPIVKAVPYPVNQAVELLKEFKHIIRIDAHPPVAFFGYPNLPSELWPEGCEVVELTSHGEDNVGALSALAETLNINDDPGPLAALSQPDLPTGELTIDKIWQSIAALMPDQTIFANEALTSGRSSGTVLATAPQHDTLTGTGGAIGAGLPLSVGAAVACPDRQVINPQADGSAMYTIQSLWTMARENLNVVSIIFNNRAYRILEGELKKVGAKAETPKAQSQLSLDNPEMNFAKMADGMGVEGTRVTTADDFNKILEGALGKEGPHLIEVMI